MFCPQCGQQQVADNVRFCSRCGFLCEGVTYLLHNRGMLPVVSQPQGPTEISPRRRGVRQGGILLLTGAVLVPILGVLNSFTSSSFMDVMVAVAAIICFLGGPLRMIYAALFEEGAPSPSYVPNNLYAPPSPAPRPVIPGRAPGALPPASARSTGGWRRPTTAELAEPPSVTENTTRLLDKEETRNQR
jgi:hypothetical protein